MQDKKVLGLSGRRSEADCSHLTALVIFILRLWFCENFLTRKNAGFDPLSVERFALPLPSPFSVMKKSQIILLVLVIAGIVGMSFFIKDLTTQETFGSAKEKGGKFVVVKVKLDKKTPVEYDAVKDPNHTVFYALDADGLRTRVVYNNAKIQDMEKSEGMDLNGYMRDGYFECNKIQTKCPSKYKDDMKAAKKNLSSGSTNQY